MLVFTAHPESLTTAFLPQLFDYVSPDIDGAAIAVGATSGRDGRSGLEFTVGGNSDGFAYAQYAQKLITAAQTQTFGFAINQTATQGSLGGRLLTLVDGDANTFGLTTQVGINIMADNTLQVIRANAQGTGIILRGTDQGADAQTTLLGASTDTLIDTAYLEVQVFHHPSVGSVTANFYNLSHVLISTWLLSNVNTAISGNNQSTSFCYGGYASTDITGTTRHHEDLAAILSDVYVLNDLTTPSDSRQPTTFIGDRAMVVVTQTDNTTSEWTPNPVQQNYLNVNETPPDNGTTENTTFTLDASDIGAMQPSSGTGTDDVYVAYSAYLKTDSSDVCVSGNPATFEGLVYMVDLGTGATETAPITSATGPPCNLSDFIAHRAQTVCTISQAGDSVTFKPSLVDMDGMEVCLSPLDIPPRYLSSTGTGGFGALAFDRVTNMDCPAGRATYLLPYWQQWQGFGAEGGVPTDPSIQAAGDFYEFQITNDGVGLWAGLNDSASALYATNPYQPAIAAIRFAEDIVGLPYFWATEFWYSTGAATTSYLAGDRFRFTHTGATIVLSHNGIPIQTFTPSVMPAVLYPFVFAGTWGFRGGSYSAVPGIDNVFVQTSAGTCVTALYNYPCVTGGTAVTFAQVGETTQWGIGLDNGTGVVGDGVIHDPGSSHTPPNIPSFGWDTGTEFTFKLDGGNVVLEIRNWVSYLDNITNVAGVGVYTYTRPYSDTDDFVLPPAYRAWPVGWPTFPQSSWEYSFTDGVANMPLRLVCFPLGDSIFALPNRAGINSVSFQFVPDGASGPASYAGVMEQSSSTRDATNASVPTDYRYAQSFLASTPSDNPITVDDFNTSTHGYKRSQ